MTRGVCIRHDCCGLTYFRVEAESDEHDEEEDGPQWRHRHARHSGRIHDKRQRDTWKTTTTTYIKTFKDLIGL